MTSKSGNREAMQPQPTGASAKDGQPAPECLKGKKKMLRKHSLELMCKKCYGHLHWLGLFLSYFFSFVFLSFSGWTTFCCIVCDGSWLLWNTQKTLPSSGAASFRQNSHCFLHALFPPGSSVRFTRSGWNTG